MRKYILILFIAVILVFQYCSQPDDLVLFPEREIINKQSEVFFKEIRIGMPQLKTIPFFIKSKNYFSAYIKLSRVISKTPYFIDILSNFENNHYELIEEFNTKIHNLDLNNYKSDKKKLFNDFEIYILLLHHLSNKYKENKLSGNTAYNYWNIILHISNNTLSQAEPNWKSFAILRVSSKMFFFKNKENFKKHRKKLKNKIKEKKPVNVFLNYIINQGDE